jgi:hypothetical protein
LRSARTTFKSLSPDFCVTLGALSEITGQRPSNFFAWNDDDEWIERLLFDMKIVGLTKKEEQKQLKKAQKSKR